MHVTYMNYRWQCCI